MILIINFNMGLVRANNMNLIALDCTLICYRFPFSSVRDLYVELIKSWLPHLKSKGIMYMFYVFNCTA